LEAKEFTSHWPVCPSASGLRVPNTETGQTIQQGERILHLDRDLERLDAAQRLARLETLIQATKEAAESSHRMFWVTLAGILLLLIRQVSPELDPTTSDRCIGGESSPCLVSRAEVTVDGILGGKTVAVVDSTFVEALLNPHAALGCRAPPRTCRE